MRVVVARWGWRRSGCVLLRWRELEGATAGGLEIGEGACVCKESWERHGGWVMIAGI